MSLAGSTSGTTTEATEETVSVGSTVRDTGTGYAGSPIFMAANFTTGDIVTVKLTVKGRWANLSTTTTLVIWKL
ncbi:MAG: hypothetical protein LBQ73_04030 [Tannerellaceae bacterium]|nr:hypothetical protein [Tannerellaceae bacterium]